MKRMMLAFSTTAMIAFIVGDAAGQGLMQPDSVRPVNYDYFAQPETEESPSDAPAEQPVVEAYDYYDDYGDYGGGWGDWLAYKLPCNKCCGDPWRLFEPTSRGIHVDGWVNFGFTAGADNPASRMLFPLMFNDREDFYMNQLYLTIGKDLSGDPYTWDWGGRIDTFFGTDAEFLEVPGLERNRDGTNKWNSHRFYRLAMPQLYVEVGRGDLSVKMGHFYTTIGYEVVPAPGNFFYSHSYTMIYGEPFTHTGAVADYKVNEQISVHGGVTNGWDNFDSVQDRGAFLGGVTWKSLDERSSLAFAIHSGQELNIVGAFTDRTVYSFVLSQQMGTNWEYVLQHDLGQQDQVNAAGADAEWYGVNQYLFYTINDCWKAGGRFEWFRDDDGFRVDGSEGNFYEVSLGLNWIPTHNLSVRPEVRWDWFEGDGSLPYDDGTKDNQFTAAFDVIYLY